jgi:hypothetical protein
VFADTTILSEKEASNAILYPAASALLWRGSARALDVRVRARSGRKRPGVEEHCFGAGAVFGAHRALPRGPRGKGKSLAILAAKLARAVYFMLRRGEPFDAERFFAH